MEKSARCYGLQISTEGSTWHGWLKPKNYCAVSYQFIGGVPGPGPDLPGAGGELTAARGAAEVVGVVRLTAEPQRIAVDVRAEECAD